MTTFRFNFNSEEEEEFKDHQEPTNCVECYEVRPEELVNNLDDVVLHAKMFVCGNVEIGHVVASEVISQIGNNDAKNVLELSEGDHSDLVPGKYEGGLKIWECTVDLIEYLMLNQEEIQLKDKNVLDLGCGVGILGIYTFLNGSTVTFQDYNKEVLECVTIPNILLNIEEERETQIKKCKFYSGDWASFNKKIEEEQVFDVILTSETIYNESNYEKLVELFLNRLSKSGVVYVAAKTCYFGVGGTVRQFEAAIARSGLLKSEVCWKSTNGIKREILKITFIDQQ